MSARSELLELLRVRSFARKPVVLASGKQSDFFIDCKQTVLTAVGHRTAGEVLLARVRSLGACDAVAGVELGGCPLASAVSLTSAVGDGATPLDAIYVRKQTKDHGSKRQIEGDAYLPGGARVTLLEDVVTTGGSTLMAVEKLRLAGYEVAFVIALVDRQEGGREAIESAGLVFDSVFTRADFMD